MLIDCHNHLGTDLFFYLNGLFPYAQDLPTMVTEGRRNRVDRWVAFPMVANLTYDLAAMRRGELVEGGLESVPYAFENERMLREIYELQPAAGRLTIPFVILDPGRKPEAQVAHLRALRNKFPFYGLKIQATMIRSPILSLLGSGRPFLDLAAEFNLPFIIHSSVASDDVWSQAQDILEIAEATPQVRFCLAHSCRFDRECLERVAALANTWFDCSAHRIHCQSVERQLPIVAAKERRFPAEYSDPSAVLRSLAEAFPEKLLWGSDSPFQSYVDRNLALYSTYEEEASCLHALPDRLKKAVARDNLLNFLQLKNEGILSPQ